MLSYAIKHSKGLPVDRPKQIYDHKTPVDAPPAPGKIKAIIAGFPW